VTQASYPVSYQTTLTSVDRPRLQQLWQSLEPRATPNFFLSWTWVNAWLTAFDPAFQLVSIQHEDELVGLGLLTARTETRHHLLHSRVLRLGRTGDPQQDQIWVEYNGLLLDARHRQSAPHAVMSHLLQQNDWDEFELGAADSQDLQHYAHADCTTVTRWSAPAYGVDLAALRNNQQEYLASLSRNTRYQINRSRKQYEDSGQLKFQVHTQADAIQQHWQALGNLHQARWGTGSGQSGFANPAFVRFHQHLIAQGSQDGQVELCTLHHNQDLLGGLYNFLYKGRIYFYLSGLRTEADSHLKPGLLLHAMAIQHYQYRHFDYYDFMGGEARYKQSLGSQHSMLQLVSFQRPRFKLKLEQGARRLKHLIQDKPSNDELPP